MDSLMKGRTVFVICSQALYGLENSNAIMVLDHGEIIERGDHEELLEQRGRYYQLYTGQLNWNNRKERGKHIWKNGDDQRTFVLP